MKTKFACYIRVAFSATLTGIVLGMALTAFTARHEPTTFASVQR